jgi:hypothetical protein
MLPVFLRCVPRAVLCIRFFYRKTGEMLPVFFSGFAMPAALNL